jgi:HEAT repeat protein
VYKGRPLRYWLTGYQTENWHWNDSNSEFANEAVRHFGTNAFPTLLHMLTAKDSALDKKLLPWSYAWRKWARKMSFLKIRPGPRRCFHDSLEATWAFKELGPQADTAVPELIRIMDQQTPTDPEYIHENVVTILAGIGPSANAAVPVLLRDLQSSNAMFRASAFYALSQIHPRAEIVVTKAITALGDPEPFVRMFAAYALESYGEEAKSSVPALVQALQTWAQNRGSQVVILHDNSIEAAQSALKAIDPEAAARAGVK